MNDDRFITCLWRLLPVRMITIVSDIWIIGIDEFRISTWPMIIVPNDKRFWRSRAKSFPSVLETWVSSVRAFRCQTTRLPFFLVRCESSHGCRRWVVRYARRTSCPDSISDRSANKTWEKEILCRSMKRWLMDKSFIDMKSLDNLSVWFTSLDAEQWRNCDRCFSLSLFLNRCEENGFQQHQSPLLGLRF